MVDEIWYGDEEGHPGRLVPLYVLVRGRTTPRNSYLDLATQIVALPVRVSALEPEYQQVLATCAQWMSVAEVASHMGKPLTVVKILVDILLEQGYLAIGAPAQQTVADRLLLESLLDGLQRL